MSHRYESLIAALRRCSTVTEIMDLLGTHHEIVDEGLIGALLEAGFDESYVHMAVAVLRSKSAHD